MMTVMVIIGLMSSAVILTLPQKKPALELQSQALLRGANTLAQTSLISGTPAALGLSESQYALMRFENGLWETETQVDFAEGIEPEFEGDSGEIKLSDVIVPLIMFEPNGLSTPFRLLLSDGDNKTLIESKGDGRVVQRPGS